MIFMSLYIAAWEWYGYFFSGFLADFLCFVVNCNVVFVTPPGVVCQFASPCRRTEPGVQTAYPSFGASSAIETDEPEQFASR